MKRVIFPALTAALMLATSHARADINWQATWTPGSPTLAVGPLSAIDFTSLSNAAYTTTTAQPIISTPVTNLSIVTTAPITAPDVFSNRSYSLTMTVTDDGLMTNNTHAFTFTGALSGNISVGGSYVSNQFGPNSTQSFTFANGDTYVVSLNGFLAPGSGTNISTSGAIGAAVAASVSVTNSGTAHSTPEPSTLALGGLGIVLAGLRSWRKQRSLAG
jgi:PEP-CTERM motif